ncbi:type II toxin-antitoxin system HicA family toxin [Adlercreutzia faecimuris]|uniref:Type II toxin-antitoxin system HicA family toxin n=1 Tax=Adlercreutzia faecimuris TaxID=2897341 RepID=A0ABS9WJL1_9ACTN|nr:type II toxin-antitoxin system HicA family toxin [Adlercreutzia sp. JBNU-10]MCI2242461.1 type II toxin-antitoxin system HicA family toxin [Adlercreutzia sp. JBNU-10]
MVKRRDVVRFFKNEGFVVMRGTNHDKLVHPDGRWTTLGRHAEIDNLLFEIMKRQAGLK